MELSMLQKHLITGLHIFSVEKDAIVGIISALDAPEEQDAMMEWMSKNENTTTAQILRKVAEICETRQLYWQRNYCGGEGKCYQNCRRF